MFYVVLASATLKLFVRFLPTTNDRLLLTEVLMGGNFQRRIHKCLWKTDVKYTLPRNHAEILARSFREGAGQDPGDLFDGSQLSRDFRLSASIQKRCEEDELFSCRAQQPYVNIGPSVCWSVVSPHLRWRLPLALCRQELKGYIWGNCCCSLKGSVGLHPGPSAGTGLSLRLRAGGAAASWLLSLCSTGSGNDAEGEEIVCSTSRERWQGGRGEAPSVSGRHSLRLCCASQRHIPSPFLCLFHFPSKWAVKSQQIKVCLNLL